MNDTEDGVKRDGLDYRAGYVEALAAFLTRLQVESVRVGAKQRPGLELCHGIALEMRKAMVAKMSGKA